MSLVSWVFWNQFYFLWQVQAPNKFFIFDSHFKSLYFIRSPYPPPQKINLFCRILTKAQEYPWTQPKAFKANPTSFPSRYIPGWVERKKEKIKKTHTCIFPVRKLTRASSVQCGGERVAARDWPRCHLVDA